MLKLDYYGIRNSYLHALDKLYVVGVIQTLLKYYS